MSIERVDWDFGLLDSLIQARGDYVIVETGIACSCRNGDQYAALIERAGRPANQRIMGCPQCRGDGFIYRNARTVKGLITSLNPVRDRSLLESGFSLPGDVTFSPELNVDIIGELDKITIPVPLEVNEGQVILRGAASLEENAQFVTDLAVNEDRLWYEAIHSIWCEDIDGVVYTQDADFVFENHKIRWIGNTPDIGTLYTIKYAAYLEWVVYSGGLDRFDRERNLGQRLMLRRKHVHFMRDNANESAATREQNQIDFTTRTKI